jgi:uncharacterized protein
MNFNQKRELIVKLLKRGRVFITAESEIEPDFADLKLPTPPELIHSVLAFAAMYVGESQTMTSEAAVLGTPALKCNTFAGRLSIPNEMENKFNLCYSFHPSDFNKLLAKIDELLSIPHLKEEWQNRRNRMLQDKIDVTGFFAWFVENYPVSVQLLKSDPDQTLQFR